MKRRRRLAVFMFLSLLIAAIPAFGLWGRYPNDKPVEAPNWPKVIVKEINAHKRVYGAGAYDSGWTFYFTGKTSDLNAFLAEVADDKATPVQIVLVPEPGSDKPDPFETELKVEYQWAIHLNLWREFAFVKREPGETDADYKKRSEQERAKIPEYSAVVTIHCAGDIDSAALKIPLRYQVSLGGRLANLADFHNRRRANLEAEPKALDSAPPTDMAAAEAPRAVFGPPSTQPAGDVK